MKPQSRSECFETNIQESMGGGLRFDSWTKERLHQWKNNRVREALGKEIGKNKMG